MKVWLRWLLSKLGLAEYFIPAFRFQCDCGRQIAAPTPKPGTMIRLHCLCGTKHELAWMGNKWKYRNLSEGLTEGYSRPAFAGADPDPQEAIDLLKSKGTEAP